MSETTDTTNSVSIGRSKAAYADVPVTSPLLAPLPRMVKRTVDLTVSLAATVVLSPLMLVIATGIKFVSAGPILYAQERIGRGGKTFRIWKFRTMAVNAEDILEEYLREHPELRDQWELEHKLRNDPRVIPAIGHLLRKSSLDELPQLWNVLRGDMTLVGPRPLPEYHLLKFDDDFCRWRSEVTPGITGLWQIASRTDGAPEMFMKWDTHYIQNWSLGLDLQILLRTPFVVLSGDGA